MRLTATRASVTSVSSASGPVFDGPALDLNFASSLSLNDAVSGTNLITFTRASSGTYVDASGFIQTAAANTARFDHDPVTNESLGLLIEEERTNLAIYSEDLSNRVRWISSPTGDETENATTAPDGLMTADRIYGQDPSGTVTKYQNYTLTANTAHTFSIHAKKSDSDWIAIRAFGFGASIDCYAWFNIADGTTGSTSGGTPDSTSVVDLSNGWYRCSLTITLAADTTGLFQLVVPEGDGVTGYSAPTVGVFLWGAQLEAGAFMSSYVPTSGSTETRSPDIASITGTNFSSWYNQSEGTVFAEFQPYSATGSQQIAGFTAGTSNSSRWGIWNDQLFIDQSGTQYSASLSPSTSLTKTAFAVAGNDAIGCSNGTLTAQDTNVVLPAVDNFHVGRTSLGQNLYNGHIKRLAYYSTRSTRKPDQELINLTT